MIEICLIGIIVSNAIFMISISKELNNANMRITRAEKVLVGLADTLYKRDK